MAQFTYQKRKNQELFKSLEDPTSLFLSETQNYIPIIVVLTSSGKDFTNLTASIVCFSRIYSSLLREVQSPYAFINVR